MDEITEQTYLSLDDVMVRLAPNQAAIHKLGLDIKEAVADVKDKESTYRSADCRLGNLRIQLAKEMKVNAILLSKLGPKA